MHQSIAVHPLTLGGSGEGLGIHWCGVEGGACQLAGGGGACSQVAEGEVPLS